MSEVVQGWALRQALDEVPEPNRSRRQRAIDNGLRAVEKVLPDGWTIDATQDPDTRFWAATAAAAGPTGKEMLATLTYGDGPTLAAALRNLARDIQRREAAE